MEKKTRNGPRSKKETLEVSDLKKILIISTSTDEEKKIEEVSLHHKKDKLSVSTLATFAQDPGWWAENEPDALIVQMPDDLLIQGYFIEKMKTVIAREVPVLILCPQISADLMTLSSHFKKIRTIKTPVNPFFLFRAVIDLTTDYGQGKNQIHPRFATDLETVLRCAKKNISVIGKLKNLSMGGAYLESEGKGAALSSGDLVRMEISVTDKKYEFDSRIVWAKELLELGMGYGLTFVTTDQVFDHLFSQL